MEPKYYGESANFNRHTPLQGKKILMIIALIVGVLTLVTIGLVIINTINSGPARNFATFTARHSDMQLFIENFKAELNNDSLKKLSAEADLVFISDNMLLHEVMLGKYGLKAVPKDISQSETDTTSEKDLEEAKLRGVYNKEYYDIFQDKLSSTLSIAQIVLNESSGNVQSSVEDVINNTKDIQQKLDAIRL